MSGPIDDSWGEVVSRPDAASGAAPATTPPVLRNLRRLEWYIRISCYFIVATPTVMAISVGLASATDSPGARRLAVCALLAAIAGVVHVLVCHTAFHHLRSGSGTRWMLRPPILVAIAVSLTCIIGLTLIAPGPVIAATLAVWTALGLVAAFVPTLTWHRLTILAAVLAGCCAVMATLVWLVVDATASGALVGGLAAGLLFVGTVWLSAWMMRVVWELDALRQVAPQLAVAEERLRFSRDLHDTFGRTLAVVAVKSELATELARRGHPDRAATEMGEVRRIAEESSRDVRGVVRGYRRPDLMQELDGARSILESAGIGCEINTAGGPLSEQAAAPLGWVVRESVTNVIRHSNATWCRLDVAVGADHATLRIDNDGVVDAPTPSSGHGLLGLTERMQLAGGTLRHERSSEEFHLIATVPRRPVPLPAPPTAVTARAAAAPPNPREDAR